MEWKRFLTNTLPAIDAATVADPRKLSSVIYTISRLAKLHSDIEPRSFAIGVLAKCTDQAESAVNHFEGSDKSLTWDQIKQTLDAQFLPDTVHTTPFTDYAKLLTPQSHFSRLSPAQIVDHGESLVLHVHICDVVDWKLFQTLTLCKLTNPALYRFVITLTPP